MERNTLIQTTGIVRLRGIIENKDNPKGNYGYKEDKTKENKPYRSLRFRIKTSFDNLIPVEIFGQTRDFAYYYSKKEKKSIKVDWNRRFDKLGGDYQLIMPEYDLAKKINDDFKDGDSIVIIGEPRFKTYEDRNGKKQLQIVYAIKSVFQSTTEINFDKNDFEEENTFAQEIIIRDIEEDKKDNKLYVYAYVIPMEDKFEPAQFVINMEAVSQSFVKNMKMLKFGDFVKVNGRVHNRVLIVEKEEDDGWGTEEKANKSFYKALEITGADPSTLEKKKYKEEDFIFDNAEDTFNGISEKLKSIGEKNSVPFNLD